MDAGIPWLAPADAAAFYPPPTALAPIEPVDSGPESDDALALLPKRTVVRIRGNARTKAALVGQTAVVRRAVGLGGWHWLVLPSGEEVKLQRNALEVLERPSGNEQARGTARTGTTPPPPLAPRTISCAAAAAQRAAAAAARRTFLRRRRRSSGGRRRSRWRREATRTSRWSRTPKTGRGRRGDRRRCRRSSAATITAARARTARGASASRASTWASCRPHRSSGTAQCTSCRRRSSSRCRAVRCWTRSARTLRRRRWTSRRSLPASCRRSSATAWGCHAEWRARRAAPPQNETVPPFLSHSTWARRAAEAPAKRILPPAGWRACPLARPHQSLPWAVPLSLLNWFLLHLVAHFHPTHLHYPTPGWPSHAKCSVCPGAWFLHRPHPSPRPPRPCPDLCSCGAAAPRRLTTDFPSLGVAALPFAAPLTSALQLLTDRQPTGSPSPCSHAAPRPRRLRYSAGPPPVLGIVLPLAPTDPSAPPALSA